MKITPRTAGAKALAIAEEHPAAVRAVKKALLTGAAVCAVGCYLLHALIAALPTC